MSRCSCCSALAALDGEIGASDFLMSIAPLRFITAGGSLAIKVFGCRTTTKDIDFFVSPNIRDSPAYFSLIEKAIGSVQQRLQLRDGWLNDEMKSWVQNSTREQLLFLSVEQDIVVYEGTNLVLYAADLEWCLEQKLHRITNTRTKPKRDADLVDAVAIARCLKESGPPLDAAFLESLDWNGFGMRKAGGIEALRDQYELVHGQVGVADWVWDETAERHRYWDRIWRRWQWI